MKKVIIKNVGKNSDNIRVNSTLKPVKRSQANVEAEEGETVYTGLNFDTLPEFYKVGGQPHSKGGTPLNLPDFSFIFSDDKKLKIKEEELQKEFLRSYKKGGYTPAELSKKFDINKYRQILADPNSDDMQRSTAEMMIANYNKKLGKLALVQESMKGFPQGIPQISIPYLTSTKFDPAAIYETQGEEETSDMDYDIAQDGKQITPSKKKNIATYDEEEKVFLKTIAPDIQLPEDIVEATQANKSGVYGRFDKKSADTNWGWYGKSINWNNKEEVGAAQKAYNDRVYDKMIKAGYDETTAKKVVSRIGFVDGQDLPNSLDKMAGKYTETRRDFNVPTKQKPTFKQSAAEQKSPGAIPTERMAYVAGKQPKADWWLQDTINVTGAAGDLNRIKKYMPWQAGIDLTTPEATYYDPTRELAANAEQANIASQASAMFAGPNQLGARLSAITGSALGNAANILGKYNNMNVSVANQYADKVAGIQNQENMVNAERATNLYDKTTIANQQFDNAKAQAREKLRGALTNAITNRAQTQSLNFMNEQYQVDPLSGGFTYFAKPRNFDPAMLKGQGVSQSIEERVNSLMTSIPGMTAEVAYKIATGK